MENTYKSAYILYVKQILEDSGISNIWLTQGQGISKQYLKKVVSGILKDQFLQKWHDEVQNCNKCILYRLFKKDLRFEKYLTDHV